MISLGSRVQSIYSDRVRGIVVGFGTVQPYSIGLIGRENGAMVTDVFTWNDDGKTGIRSVFIRATDPVSGQVVVESVVGPASRANGQKGGRPKKEKEQP